MTRSPEDIPYPRPGFRECLDPFCHAYDAWDTHYHEDVSNARTPRQILDFVGLAALAAADAVEEVT